MKTTRFYLKMKLFLSYARKCHTGFFFKSNQRKYKWMQLFHVKQVSRAKDEVYSQCSRSESVDSRVAIDVSGNYDFCFTLFINFAFETKNLILVVMLCSAFSFAPRYNEL